MTLANWKPDYETGNPAIDSQHKKALIDWMKKKG